MLGTAFPADRILLVEQPGGWGKDGLAASRFDRAVAAQLIQQLGRRNIRVLAIRRPGRSPEPEQRQWGYADCRVGRQQLSWGTFEADDELLRLDLDAVEPSVDQRPVYAVCAHGTHDMCCAIEGRPVAAALDRECPGRSWECSHVGGDRFAANVLVLPTGQQYGQVTDASRWPPRPRPASCCPTSCAVRSGWLRQCRRRSCMPIGNLGFPTVGAVRAIQADPEPHGVFQRPGGSGGSAPIWPASSGWSGRR